MTRLESTSPSSLILKIRISRQGWLFVNAFLTENVLQKAHFLFHRHSISLQNIHPCFQVVYLVATYLDPAHKVFLTSAELVLVKEYLRSEFFSFLWCIVILYIWRKRNSGSGSSGDGHQLLYPRHRCEICSARAGGPRCSCHLSNPSDNSGWGREGHTALRA